MKRVFISTLTLLMLVFLLVCPASVSEEKVHIIESAQFDVFLNEDGSADITETWGVTFLSGKFSRFRRFVKSSATLH